MKTHILLLLYLLTFSIYSKADAWDNLTEKQAKSVVKFLKKYPYIFDYCDCCTDAPVFLLRVNSAEVTTCYWDQTQFSVVAEVEQLAKMESTGSGLHNYVTHEVSEEESYVTYTITMNYTFVFDPKQKWAVPFFKMIPYHLNHVCIGAANYPNPTHENVKVKDAGYVNWYKKYVGTK